MLYQPNNIDLSRTVLAGMTTLQLQTAYATAQQAYIDLMTGGKPITVSYAQGDGQKTVVYHKTDMMNLTMFIQQLQVQLGISNGRRPMRPFFSAR